MVARLFVILTHREENVMNDFFVIPFLAIWKILLNSQVLIDSQIQYFKNSRPPYNKLREVGHVYAFQ